MESNGSNLIAKYWKVAGATITPTVLTNGTNNASGQSIFVNGSDVYVAGHEYITSDKK